MNNYEINIILPQNTFYITYIMIENIPRRVRSPRRPPEIRPGYNRSLILNIRFR